MVRNLDHAKSELTLAKKRLRALRVGLAKLAVLEYVDSGDAKDLLDADDDLRRGRT